MKKKQADPRHRMLCFAPAHNKKGRKDATGAFIPEAERFLKHHGQSPDMLYLIDNTESRAGMKRQVLSALKEYKGHELDGVFFFCHGYKRGMQFGFTIKNLEKLANAIFDACGTNPKVVFYSCDVGRDRDRHRTDDMETMGGDGGFADEMRDALCVAGARWCRVDGHTTPGHCCRNSHVRRFEGDGSVVGGKGGYYIVPRQKKSLFKRWRELLRTTYRFDFPFTSTQLILCEVSER